MMYPACAFRRRIATVQKCFCGLTVPAKVVSLNRCLACPHAGSLDGAALVPLTLPTDANRVLPCTLRGEAKRTVTCELCGGRSESVPIHSCEKHGECATNRFSQLDKRLQICLTCSDRIDPDAIELPPLTGPANLMFHLYPLRKTRDIWQPQLERVQSALENFPGLKLLSLAVDQNTDEDSLELAGWSDIEILPNHPHQWELPGWQWAMGRLKDQPGFTIRLHAKGAARGRQEDHLRRWWELSYDALLDLDKVRAALQSHLICGTFRLNTPMASLRVPWIFAGSFYAFRNAEIFAGDWEPKSQAPADHYVEAWPALVSKKEQAACIAFDGVPVNLYDAKAWRPAPGMKLEPGPAQPMPKNAALMPEELNQTPPLVTKSSGVSPPRTETPQVAIVIAGRNNAEFLGEAIESALAQSVPCEVVYADDCSTDESVAIATGYLGRGLRVLPSGTHRGVCDARNRGAAATRAPYLITLDSDDKLPPDFAAKHLEALQPGTPFVYGPAQAFGTQHNLWYVPAWADYDRWAANTVNTCAMYARWAFEAAGGWDAEVPTMWDYDLMLRASRLGTPRPSEATMLYRIHGQSFSASIDERDDGKAVEYREIIRRRNARVGVSSLISGRLPDLFRRWLDALALSVRFADLCHKPRLQLWLHNDAEPDYAAISQYAETFASIELHRIAFDIPQEPETERRNGVASLLANYSGLAQATANCDLLWLVEDDILVPRNACRLLFDAATEGQNPPIGVSGVYRNRHLPEKCLGGWWSGQRRSEPANFGPEIQPVGFVGTGCLMFWTDRPATPKGWKSHCTVEPQPAHDFAWSEAVKGRLLIHGGVCCGHAKTETEILQA